MQRPIDTVGDLQRALVHGGAEVFDIVPRLLGRILEGRAWAQRLDRDGVPFKSFADFVQARRWEGLGSNIEELQLYCKRPEFAAVKAAILREVPEAGSLGTNRHTGGGGNNITSSSGTNPTYTLRRLKRDRPDLAERVINRELSANAAAIEAGWRRPTITVPDDPEAIATALVKRWGICAARRAVDAAAALNNSDAAGVSE